VNVVGDAEVEEVVMADVEVFITPNLSPNPILATTCASVSWPLKKPSGLETNKKFRPNVSSFKKHERSGETTNEAKVMLRKININVPGTESPLRSGWRSRRRELTSVSAAKN